jgi:hypothetical protein
VLGSRHKGIDSEAGTSSSRTAPGSLKFRNTVDQGTSTRARRRRRDPGRQSSNVTSARSDLTPKAVHSSSDDFPITTSRSSGLPLSQISNLPSVSLARKGAKMRAVKRIAKSMLQSRLVPKLLDHDEDDSACASGKARKGRHPNDHRIFFCPCDTPSPYSSVSATRWHDHEFEN